MARARGPSVLDGAPLHMRVRERSLLLEPVLVVLPHELAREHVAADDGASRRTFTVERPVVVRLDVVLEVVDGLLFGLAVPEHGGTTLPPCLPEVHLQTATPVDAVFTVFLLRVDFERHRFSPCVRGHQMSDLNVRIYQK